MKIGLVLEGGALRGVFTSGALEVIKENGITFPYVVGASAGSGNLYNWVAGHPGRTRLVLNPPKKDTYYGPRSFFKSGRLVDLDKMFFEYCYKQFPFDFASYRENCRNVFGEVVVTDCQTGKPLYLTENEDETRMLTIGKASCSVPLLSPPVALDGTYCLDGSITDSIPVHRALEMGCDKVVVIMTRRTQDPPSDFNKVKLLLKMKYGRRYPDLVDACMRRCDMYEAQRRELEEFEKQGVAFVLRPDNKCIRHFNSDREKIDAFYFHGRSNMEKRMKELLDFVGCADVGENCAPAVKEI